MLKVHKLKSSRSKTSFIISIFWNPQFKATFDKFDFVNSCPIGCLLIYLIGTGYLPHDATFLIVISNVNGSLLLKRLDLSKQPIRQLKLTHKYLTKPNDTQFSILMQNVHFVQSFLKNLNRNNIINIFHGSSLTFKNALVLIQKVFQLKLANVVKLKLLFYGLILL